MGTSEIFITALVSVVVWFAILSSIIAGASRSKKIELQLRKQTDLLAKMAQKAGVLDSEINVIINQVLG